MRGAPCPRLSYSSCRQPGAEAHISRDGRRNSTHAWPLFAVLLSGAIGLLAALTFFPALSLTPIAEHYPMQAGNAIR